MSNNVTVIICCYNAEAYLEETLLALNNQKFKEFDILIIDDCSTDNTSRLIRSYITSNNIHADIVTFDAIKVLPMLENLPLSILIQLTIYF